MIARFGRRLLEALVALFALLGFALVPLGEHTGLEHLQAIASTSAARKAARELVQAGVELRQRLTRALVSDRDPRVRDAVPQQPDLRPEPPNARLAPEPSAIDASAPWLSGS